MKIFQFFCAALAFTVGSCLVELDPELRNAKFATDDPRVSDVFAKLFGNVSESGRAGRIVSGTPAKLGQFPYQSLQFMLQNIARSWYMCGGSFIRYNWVLTVSF